jgi:pyruvate/2-oxoglutarate dehydrogenase complex dihydrolipoamide acyltransferase (E2) component
MAIIEVKVPQLSESVAEATLLTWHKKVGESVARDENLIDVETDKVVLELPAPDAGVITQIIKGDGSTVVAGEVIAILDTAAAAGTVATPAAAPAAVAAARQLLHLLMQNRRLALLCQRLQKFWLKTVYPLARLMAQVKMAGNER